MELAVLCRQFTLKSIGNVLNCLLNAGGACIKVGDSGGSTVPQNSLIVGQ